MNKLFLNFIFFFWINPILRIVEWYYFFFCFPPWKIFLMTKFYVWKIWLHKFICYMNHYLCFLVLFFCFHCFFSLLILFHFPNNNNNKRKKDETKMIEKSFLFILDFNLTIHDYLKWHYESSIKIWLFHSISSIIMLSFYFFFSFSLFDYLSLFFS